MPEQRLRAQGLRASELLQGLLALAQHNPDDAALVFQRMHIKLDESSSDDDPVLTIALRDLNNEKTRSKINKAYKHLVEFTPRSPQFIPVPVDLERDGYRDARDTIPALILSTINVVPSGEPPPDSLETECVVLIPSGAESASDQVARARRFATQVRTTVGKLHSKDGTTSGYATVLWISDDDDRFSWHTPDSFPDDVMLAVTEFSWREGTARYAFPITHRPNRQRLTLIAELFFLLPDTFGLPDRWNGGEFFGASYPAPDGEQLRFLFLGAAPFGNEYIDPVVYVAPVETPVSAIYALRHDQELAERIRDEADGRGYRLHLRPTRYLQPDQERANEIEQQIYELNADLLALHEHFRYRPELFCFVDQQIPSLVEVLASLHPSMLKHGAVQYAFHGPVDQWPGRHFLLLTRPVARTELERLVYWTEAAQRPVKYWIDPTWASMYETTGTQSMLFVPDGMVLAPNFHSFDADQMDVYLRRTVGEWFHGEFGAQHMPDDPMYIFEDLPVAGALQLHVSVISRSAFQPFTNPNVIGWLNDTVLPIQHAEDLREYITSLAHHERRQAAVISARQATTVLEDELRISTERASERLATQTQHIIDIITREMATLEQRTLHLVQQSRALNSVLTELDGLYKHTHGGAETARDTATESAEDLDSLKATVAKLVEEAEATIDDSMASRVRIEEQVATELRSIVNIRARVNQMIETILRGA